MSSSSLFGSLFISVPFANSASFYDLLFSTSLCFIVFYLLVVYRFSKLFLFIIVSALLGYRKYFFHAIPEADFCVEKLYDVWFSNLHSLDHNEMT